MIARTLFACAALALTAACDRSSEVPSAEQGRQMNEAAEMLDQAPGSLSNVDDAGLSEELEPGAAANGSGSQ